MLADCFDPVMSMWESASGDSTWTHNRRAVADDPKNGDAWLSVWKHAVARGDSAWERRSLETLSRIGFFTGAALAYNRWQLERLPANAVLLTNGDMDTFPSVVLQGALGVRRDGPGATNVRPAGSAPGLAASAEIGIAPVSTSSTAAKNSPAVFLATAVSMR